MSCQTPHLFLAAVVLFTIGLVGALAISALLWQRWTRSRLDRLLLASSALGITFYGANLAGALGCVWIDGVEAPATAAETVLYLLQVAAITAWGPVTRHVVYERFTPRAAASRGWCVRNYLPAAAALSTVVALGWLRPDWVFPASRHGPLHLHVATSVVLLYLVPGSLRPYIAYLRGPGFADRYGWRRQMRFGGLIVATLVLAAVGSLLLPIAHRSTADIALTLSLKMVPLAGSIVSLHSILRYGFLDIVLKRSLLYGIVGTLLLGVYLILAFLARQTPLGDLGVALPAARLAGALAGVAIMAAVFRPLREQCERLLDATVFRSATNVRKNLLALAQALPRTADGAALVEAVARGLARALPVSGAGVGLTIERRWFAAGEGALGAPTPEAVATLLAKLADGGAVDVSELSDDELGRRLRADGVELVIPVGPGAPDGGVLLLGRKPSGAIFLGEERALLESFAARVAASLEHTRLLAAHLAMGRELARAEQLAAVGNLAARLAHEIRNPITAVKSLSQLVERDPGAPESLAHLQIVREELDRVERRVAALLRLTREEEYHFETVDPSDLVREVVEQLRGRLAESGVNLAPLAFPRVAVRADREKLRQVLVNLVQNAVEAMEGVPDKRLTVTIVAGDNGAAQVSIADRGPGVRSEEATRIFEPFVTTKASGTGLGLAIAKRIVEAHAGVLSVAPGPEGGAVFVVQLPTVRAMEKAE